MLPSQDRAPATAACQSPTLPIAATLAPEPGDQGRDGVTAREVRLYPFGGRLVLAAGGLRSAGRLECLDQGRVGLGYVCSALEVSDLG